MSDNVILPGTGETVAADVVGNAYYQRVKISLGADGTATDLGLGQAASAASMPVVLASDGTPAFVGPNAVAPLSGQITGLGIGTAVQGGSVALTNGVFLKALNSNAGTVWVGNVSGSVAGTTGYPLQANDSIVVQVSNLNLLYFDAPTTDKVAWLKG